MILSRFTTESIEVIKKQHGLTKEVLCGEKQVFSQFGIEMMRETWRI